MLSCNFVCSVLEKRHYEIQAGVMSLEYTHHATNSFAFIFNTQFSKHYLRTTKVFSYTRNSLDSPTSNTIIIIKFHGNSNDVSGFKMVAFTSELTTVRYFEDAFERAAKLKARDKNTGVCEGDSDGFCEMNHG